MALHRRIQRGGRASRGVSLWGRGALVILAALACAAAVHDEIPGLCLHQNSHPGVDDCPLCQVKYHILATSLVILAVAALWLASAAAMAFPYAPPSRQRIFLASLRGRAPPAACLL